MSAAFVVGIAVSQQREERLYLLVYRNTSRRSSDWPSSVRKALKHRGQAEKLSLDNYLWYSEPG